MRGRSAFRLVVKVASELGREGEETLVKKLHKISQIYKQSEECQEGKKIKYRHMTELESRQGQGQQ